MSSTVELTPQASRVLKQGPLFKASRHMRVWRARWFVLEADLLCYYAEAKEPPALSRPRPKGVITLHGSVIQKVADPLGFKLVTPKRMYTLRAETLRQAQVCWPPCNRPLDPV